MPNSTNALSAPLTNASKIASKNRCWIRRRRSAPSAARIDSSRSRLAPRTSIMPEMFRHTISSTVPARLSRTLITRRLSGRPAAPIEVYGSTVAALNSFDRGIALRQTGDGRRDQRIRLRDVHARVEPAVDPHPVRRSGRREDSDSAADAGAAPGERTAGSSAPGRSGSGHESPPARSRPPYAGRHRSSRTFPTMSGSAAIRLCQKSWLRTTRGSADGRVVDRRIESRVRARATRRAC